MLTFLYDSTSNDLYPILIYEFFCSYHAMLLCQLGVLQCNLVLTFYNKDWPQIIRSHKISPTSDAYSLDYGFIKKDTNQQPGKEIKRARHRKGHWAAVHSECATLPDCHMSSHTAAHQCALLFGFYTSFIIEAWLTKSLATGDLFGHQPRSHKVELKVLIFCSWLVSLETSLIPSLRDFQKSTHWQTQVWLKGTYE